MAEWVNVVSSGRGYSISDQRGSFPLMKRDSAGPGPAIKHGSRWKEGLLLSATPRIRRLCRGLCGRTAVPSLCRKEKGKKDKTKSNLPDLVEQQAAICISPITLLFVCINPEISAPSAAPRGWLSHRFARIARCDVSNCV